MPEGVVSKILDSPFLVAPILGIGIGLAFVPFVVFGTDHAAEFYGSFFSALATVLAVVATAYFTRRSEQTHQHQQRISDAVELYYWSHRKALRAVYDRGRLNAIQRRIGIGPAKRPILLGEVRRYLSICTPEEVEKHAINAAKLPPQIGAKIVAALHTLADPSALEEQLADKPDDTEIRSVSHLIKNYAAYRTLLDGMRADISHYLVAEGWFKEQDVGELEEFIEGVDKRTT